MQIISMLYWIYKNIIEYVCHYGFSVYSYKSNGCRLVLQPCHRQQHGATAGSAPHDTRTRAYSRSLVEEHDSSWLI